MLMATLTDIRKHSIVHPAALIPRNCRLTNHCTLCSLTNAGCSVPLQNQSKALPPVCLHSGLQSSLRCAQLHHHFSTHSSNISRARGPHLPNVSTANGTNTLSADTTASYFRIFPDSRTLAEIGRASCRESVCQPV